MALILDAAGAVFAEKGVDGATMTEIAERSGTAIGSLYRFFPTKEGIALTLLERFIEDRLAKLDQIKRKAGLGRAMQQQAPCSKPGSTRRRSVTLPRIFLQHGQMPNSSPVSGGPSFRSVLSVSLRW
ncbi:TetR/AcrR family transcriptional regulator [Asaia astilbis]|uniref:TetR/AcrR family transcriptional regulator n=1 Tax=Asaia astilbis TaxID=610244 RepID=UPI000471B5DF|nr:helix-turn-helix domain-containing protein [Asaia astilbis]